MKFLLNHRSARNSSTFGNEILTLTPSNQQYIKSKRRICDMNE